MAAFAGAGWYTQGGWKGVYRQDGNVIAQNVSQPPSYSTLVNVLGALQMLESLYSYDDRALVKPSLS